MMANDENFHLILTTNSVNNIRITQEEIIMLLTTGGVKLVYKHFHSSTLYPTMELITG